MRISFVLVLVIVIERPGHSPDYEHDYEHEHEEYVIVFRKSGT